MARVPVTTALEDFKTHKKTTVNSDESKKRLLINTKYENFDIRFSTSVNALPTYTLYYVISLDFMVLGIYSFQNKATKMKPFFLL